MKTKVAYHNFLHEQMQILEELHLHIHVVSVAGFEIGHDFVEYVFGTHGRVTNVLIKSTFWSSAADSAVQIREIQAN